MYIIHFNPLDKILLILWWEIINDDIKPVFWSIRAVSLHHPTSRNPNDPFSALLLMKTNFWAPGAMRRTKKTRGKLVRCVPSHHREQPAVRSPFPTQKSSPTRTGDGTNCPPRFGEISIIYLWLGGNRNFFTRQSKHKQIEIMGRLAL